MENNKSQEIEELESSEIKSKTKKLCICKKALGYIVLTTILVLFCILEIAVLILIFSVFSVFYVVILITLTLYLMYRGLKKISQYYTNKQNSKIQD
jgi:hypothetical protein